MAKHVRSSLTTARRCDSRHCRVRRGSDYMQSPALPPTPTRPRELSLPGSWCPPLPDARIPPPVGPSANSGLWTTCRGMITLCLTPRYSSAACRSWPSRSRRTCGRPAKSGGSSRAVCSAPNGSADPSAAGAFGTWARGTDSPISRVAGVVPRNPARRRSRPMRSTKELSGLSAWW
jgi:hypothetical protein